jgi:membrane-associated protease RseP (regulator of RpoE activity)
MSNASRALLAAALLATPLATGRLAAEDRLPRAVVVSGGADIASTDGDAVVVQAPRVRVHRFDRRSRLGISLVDITPELRSHFGAPKDAGVLVGSVEKDSPAARAGIEVGDIVTTVDGEKCESSGEIGRAIRGKSAGETVSLEVIRKGSAKKLTAKVEERPAGERETELHGALGRDFSRDLSREIQRGLREAGPEVWDFDFKPRREWKQLEEKIQGLERRIQELEGGAKKTP